MPRSYIASTITAIAPVAALPTTAAHFSLYNAEKAGGKSYIISTVGFTPVTSAAAALVQQLLAHNSVAAVSAMAGTGGTAARGPKALDGLPPTSAASVASAVTIVNDGIWHPVGLSVNGGAATATIAMGSWANVNGIYVVPPGGLFSLAVLCNAVAGTNQIFVTWSEA